MLYIVAQRNERKYFMNRELAYDYTIREVLKHNIDTSSLYVPDIGIEIYDTSEEPMVFEDYLVIDNLEKFMYTNDYSFDDVYIEPKLAYGLYRSQPIYDF